MPACAPRISPRLLAIVDQLARGRLHAAEINRHVGVEADRMGLTRPSYQRVRVLVNAARRLHAQREPTTVQILMDISLRSRPPDALVDHLAGVGVPKRR